MIYHCSIKEIFPHSQMYCCGDKPNLTINTFDYINDFIVKIKQENPVSYLGMKLIICKKCLEIAKNYIVFF